MPFADIPALGNLLSVGDILLAMIIGLVATFFIARIRNFLLAITQPMNMMRSPNDLKGVIRRCYRLFPMQVFDFNGITINRGMFIRVKTNNSQVFEGLFVGINKENIICVLTKEKLAADMLENISEISLVNSTDENFVLPPDEDD